MTRPNESVSKVFHVVDIDGNPITGLDDIDFDVTAYADGVAYAENSSIDEIGDGAYKWTYDTPPSRAQVSIFIQPTNADYYAVQTPFRSAGFVGEIENEDLDSLYSRQARPVVRLNAQGSLGTVQPITLYKDRWSTQEFTILDEDGDPILLASDYSNWQVAVRSHDQSTIEWNGTGATITPNDDGLLQIEIPENASFFSALDEGEDQIVLFWEVVADVGGVASKTIAVIPSSQLTLKRSEVGQ